MWYNYKIRVPVAQLDRARSFYLLGRWFESNRVYREPEQKEFSWLKLKSIKKELDKCDLLCSNCHAEIHNPESFLKE